MKRTTLLALMLFITAAFTSCKKDSDSRDSFVATYSVTETWTENSKTLTKPPFSMPINKSALKSNVLLFNNFANYGDGVTAEATVIGNTFTIAQQTLPNLKAISGSGSLAGSTLTFTYTESYNGISIIVSTVAKMK